MPSTYNELGTELMVTGEKSGQWGTITNTNWNILQMAVSGYATQAVTDGGTTALTITDGSTSTSVARNMVLKLTGSLTGTSTVTVPNSVEKLYLVQNATTGGQTITFKTVSGTGVSWSTTTTKLLFSDGTNIVDTQLGVTTDPAGSNTQVQYNNSGAFGASSDLIFDSNGLSIGSQKQLRLLDTTGGEYIAFKAAGTASNQILTWPAAYAGGNGYVLKSTTGGVLSWEELSAGGTSWQAVITADPGPAVAGNGYFCNTTGGAFNLTLPASPTIGDEITFVDYAGTFATNNLTIARNGKNIQGSAANLTVATNRAANTLVFVDNTQGWLLSSN